MDPIIDELVKVLGAALAGVIIWAATQLARKFGVELSLAQQEKIGLYARQAILSVEEKAAALVKAQAGKLSAGEKLAGAVELLVQRVPGIDRDEAAEIIHQQLPVVRGAAVSFGTAVLQKATRRSGRK